MVMLFRVGFAGGVVDDAAAVTVGRKTATELKMKREQITRGMRALLFRERLNI